MAKRSKAVKPAVPYAIDVEIDRIPRQLKGEWTKDTAVLPQSMRDDPLSVFVNTMNLWGLMATGWCAIARASWGLD